MRTVEDAGPYEVSLCWIWEGRPLPYGEEYYILYGRRFASRFQKGGSICKNSDVLFTFAEIYDTMKLLKILIRRRRLK